MENSMFRCTLIFLNIKEVGIENNVCISSAFVFKYVGHIGTFYNGTLQSTLVVYSLLHKEKKYIWLYVNKD